MQPKKPDISKQKFGRSSFNATKEKRRKNVTEMRVLIYSGGREQGRPRSSNKHHPVLQQYNITCSGHSCWNALVDTAHWSSLRIAGT